MNLLSLLGNSCVPFLRMLNLSRSAPRVVFGNATASVKSRSHLQNHNSGSKPMASQVEALPEVTEESSNIDQETQKRYRIWKKNSPHQYDYVSTHSLLWPSLTVQFFPDLEKSLDTDTTQYSSQLLYQRILTGTFTLGQGTDNISIWQLPYYKDLNQDLNVDQISYNSDKKEFEMQRIPQLKLKQLQSINHYGDVNKLRYMPQNPDVIASANNFGNLAIFNRTRHSNIKTLGSDQEIDDPQLRLFNEEKPTSSDIFALDWNRQKEGVLVSASADGIINLFDVKSGFVLKNDINVRADRYYEVGDSVNDIEWIPNHDSLFISADEKGHLSLFDVRTSQSRPFTCVSGGNPLNSVSVNPNNDFCLATGSSSGELKIWDLRTLSQHQPSLLDLNNHSDAITQVKWHPHIAGVIGSSSSDRLVKIHDLSKQKLIFSHEGHMLGVNDFDWSLHDDWLLVSVADDNSLHTWKPSKQFLY